MSIEDLHLMNIVNSSTKLIGNHYYVDLPFKKDNPNLPNNCCVAEQHLQNLKGSQRTVTTKINS